MLHKCQLGSLCTTLQFPSDAHEKRHVGGLSNASNTTERQTAEKAAAILCHLKQTQGQGSGSDRQTPNWATHTRKKSGSLIPSAGASTTKQTQAKCPSSSALNPQGRLSAGEGQSAFKTVVFKSDTALQRLKTTTQVVLTAERSLLAFQVLYVHTFYL